MNSPDAPQADPVPPAGQQRARFLWPLFVVALFGPPVLTAMAAMMDPKGGAAPALAVLGGAAGGIVGGVMLGCRLGGSTAAKAILSIILAGVVAFAVFTMCGLGCAIGGYKVDFR